MRTDDGHIIYQCLNGDPEAFGILVDKYREGIYAYTYAKLQNWHDAEDVSQEVFVQAYRKLHTLKNWDSFAGWLYRIASNLCKNWQKSKSKRPDLDFIEDQDSSILEEPSIKSYHENEMIDSVHEALSSLSEAYREVLTLYYLSGMDSNKIAEALGTSPTVIRNRLSRARSHLREEIFTMMNTTFSEQKLKVGFTFRIVEAIKRIKIQPMSPTKGVPWGVSLAAGLIFTILSLNSHFNPIIMLNSLGGSFLPSESKVLKVGEIPVDMTNISKVTFLSSMKGNGNSSNKSFNQNAFFMAPKAEGKWEKKADMLNEKTGLAACVLNGKILTFGGSSKLGALTSVEEYDPATDKWTKKQDMPTPKTWHQICVINGKAYIIGDMLDRVSISEYDPLKNIWVKKTELPTPRMLFSSCVINGMIYVFSGTQGNDAEKPSVEVYDPSKDEWTKKKDMPVAREGASASVVKGKVYIIGGWKPNQTLNTVEEYDPIKDEWKNKSPIPTARWIHSACVVNDKIYVIGGCSGSLPAVSTVEVYDPATDTWEKIADISTARCFFSAVEVDGRIFAIGGSPIYWDVVPNGEVLSSVEEYDTGFRPPQAIQSKGKLPTTWGNKKK
jgi:RNA polymerase sigma factor (sigma-70 family)